MQGRALDHLTKRLRTTPDVFLQERLDKGHHCDCVAWIGQTVAFIGENHEINRQTPTLHRSRNGFTLPQLHPRIIGSVAQQERAADPIDMVDRRDGIQVDFADPDHAIENHSTGLPVRRERIQEGS